MRSHDQSPLGTAAAYVGFAVASTMVNFATQELVLRLTSLGPALVVGTAAGFSVKYLLDKRWIFHDRYDTPGTEARKVTLYALFSVLTTAVFWGFEIGFWLAFGTDTAKYAGGALGLALGYAAKYALDRRYTFRGTADAA